MVRRALRLLTLQRAERRLVLRAVATYARVRWLLWQRGLAGVQRLHHNPGGFAPAAPPTRSLAGPRDPRSVRAARSPRSLASSFAPLPPRQVARLVAAALRPFGANCLGESLTLVVLLQRLAYPASLRIGARRAPAGLEAHAWVELDGVPLNDRPDIAADYSPFEQPETEIRFV